MTGIKRFTEQNFQQLCNTLAHKDAHLKKIIDQHSYPPMWRRPPSFETLIHIILEQQVSLASAKAALEKLREKIDTITPGNLLALTDEELRACYFSRQKTGYARHLAQAMLSNQLNLEKLSAAPDDEVRAALKQIKGIGDWTVDVYLLFVLQRADIFPLGDLAMVNALKEVKQLSKQAGKEDMLALAEAWRPHRSIATMLLWHHYIKTKNIRL